MGGQTIGQPRQMIPEQYRARRLAGFTSFSNDPRMQALMSQLAQQFSGQPNAAGQVFSGPGGLPIFEVGQPDLMPGSAGQDAATAPTVPIDPVLGALLMQLQQQILSGAGGVGGDIERNASTGGGAELGRPTGEPAGAGFEVKQTPGTEPSPIYS